MPGLTSLLVPNWLWFRLVELEGTVVRPWRDRLSHGVSWSATRLFNWWPWPNKDTTVNQVDDAIRLALAHIRHAHANGVFLAYGTDGGRILLVAAAEPFEELIGLESVAMLVEVASRNVRRQASPEVAQRTKVLCAAGDEFAVPAEVMTVFLWNVSLSLPLDGILRQLGKSLQQHPRSLRAIYAAPTEADIAALLTCSWVDDMTPIPTFEHEGIRLLVLEHFSVKT